MPELPEVETLKRELERAVKGKTIVEVRIAHPRVIRQPAPAAFKKGLEATTITGVQRKAKVLIIGLSSGKSLVIHLKMTGQLLYPGNGAKSRVRFIFSDGTAMDFNDQRLFAELRLMEDWRSLPFIQGLGPEPGQLSLEEFKALLATRKTRIKPLLMDQTVISGVGNLYAAECLFRAKIYPERPAQSLTAAEQEKLYLALRDVLNDAVNYGGSSVDDYVRLTGKPGEYVSQHKVYGREHKPCFICKTPIKRVALGGRGTYFCPSCQR
ncbi:MAG TPA: bifunctional DNA-formamidopyrimidine glycosylase/DNA-(apurinic or apyrimidinic site) lyase [Candidatus Omnitrophota bacterium]|nr:bifunctional DNA-formamidopyrimidine glycosylase/DNA-(apurinic or apyrimidinic site) lyase [Candidatus Omnitrophota bacterium]